MEESENAFKSEFIIPDSSDDENDTDNNNSVSSSTSSDSDQTVSSPTLPTTTSSSFVSASYGGAFISAAQAKAIREEKEKPVPEPVKAPPGLYQDRCIGKLARIKQQEARLSV